MHQKRTIDPEIRTALSVQWLAFRPLLHETPEENKRRQEQLSRSNEALGRIALREGDMGTEAVVDDAMDEQKALYGLAQEFDKRSPQYHQTQAEIDQINLQLLEASLTYEQKGNG